MWISRKERAILTGLLYNEILGALAGLPGDASQDILERFNAYAKLCGEEEAEHLRREIIKRYILYKKFGGVDPDDEFEWNIALLLAANK